MLSLIDRYLHAQYHRLGKALRKRDYLRTGRRPWSRGYSDFREDYLINVLRDQNLLHRFRDQLSLPSDYGYRLDERVVEYPWVLSRLKGAGTSILDAGSTLNFSFLLALPILERESLVIYTLVPEQTYGRSNVSYFYGDLRHTILKDNVFDEIVCISTLEHIGLDNTQIYTDDQRYKESRPFDYRDALREFRRLLVPGGHLLLTIPYGKYQNLGWQQQFDAEMLNDIFNTFGGEVQGQVFYRYWQEQWNLTDQKDCENCEYYDIHQSDDNEDGAAAARAVACVDLVKT